MCFQVAVIYVACAFSGNGTVFSVQYCNKCVRRTSIERHMRLRLLLCLGQLPSRKYRRFLACAEHAGLPVVPIRAPVHECIDGGHDVVRLGQLGRHVRLVRLLGHRARHPGRDLADGGQRRVQRASRAVLCTALTRSFVQDAAAAAAVGAAAAVVAAAKRLDMVLLLAHSGKLLTIR